MQFRSQTLFIVIATMAAVLTLSAGVALPLRIAVAITMLLAWGGAALLATAAPGWQRGHTAPLLMGLLGIGIVSLATSAIIVMLGYVLKVKLTGSIP